MTLRIVSITHPSLGGPVGTERLGLLGDAEVTILTPHAGHGAPQIAGDVRRISIRARGSDRGARFPSLAVALSLLDPDVVHLHAQPDTALACQVARLCGPPHRRGLVLETDMHEAAMSRLALRRARQTLARTHAVLARTAGALAALRRLGFDGLGFVAGLGVEPQKLPPAADARLALHIDPSQRPVLGWLGPLQTTGHLADLLEALTLAHSDVAVVVPAATPAYHDVLDRADALEVLHRVRFAPPEQPGAVMSGRLDPTAFPTLLAAADALILAPPANLLDRVALLRSVEIAHTHALPVIHPNLPDISETIGAGGWQGPFGDPAMMARLFDELHARPKLLAAAAAAAHANAAARHSPRAAATALARAIHAASSHAGIAWADRSGSPGLALALNRQPGGT